MILIANIKDRLRHGIKEYGFLFDEEIECPVLCIEVNSGEDMDEFMISACKECEVEEHSGEVTEMVRTNADRIRRMTDEELAELIYKTHGCPVDEKVCYLGKGCNICIDGIRYYSIQRTKES